MVRAVKSHFETPETRQKYLSDLRNTTLTKVIQPNRDKTKLECLELLTEKLRKITRGLGKSEEELREQLLNACRGIQECNFALQTCTKLTIIVC
jgi:dissimilatory sulfite reductase (desulfoviridin) alpha/beta subunit